MTLSTLCGFLAFDAIVRFFAKLRMTTISVFREIRVKPTMFKMIRCHSEIVQRLKHLDFSTALEMTLSTFYGFLVLDAIVRCFAALRMTTISVFREIRVKQTVTDSPK